MPKIWPSNTHLNYLLIGIHMSKTLDTSLQLFCQEIEKLETRRSLILKEEKELKTAINHIKKLIESVSKTEKNKHQKSVKTEAKTEVKDEPNHQ